MEVGPAAKAGVRGWVKKTKRAPMKKLVFLFFMALALVLNAQEDSSKWTVSGYVKNMQVMLFFNDAYTDF